jgi:catechol 2,3-dioxygenase
MKPALTHMGIFTDRPEAMRDFYVSALGLVVSDTGHGMLFKRRIIFLTGEATKHHQLVLVVREHGDPQGGALFQISFKLNSLDELRAATALAIKCGATDMQGMNHGNSWSVYVRDPDGNRVELYLDTDWYVPQPFADPLQLELSDTEIRALTAARVKQIPGSLPVAEWAAGMKQKLG